MIREREMAHHSRHLPRSAYSYDVFLPITMVVAGLGNGPRLDVGTEEDLGFC
jgi:hypothetical protein